MKELNIPIYRAKRVDSNEYIEGYLLPFEDSEDLYIKHCVDTSYINADYFKEYDYQWFEDLIDPTTLAIHFPDITDNEGNRIFASLSEDGKGGDVVEIGAFMEKYQKANVIYKDGRILMQQEEDETHMSSKYIEILEITVSKIKK